MQVRTPAVAGMFYPKEKEELKTVIHNCFLHPLGPEKIPPTSNTNLHNNNNENKTFNKLIYMQWEEEGNE